MRLPGPFDFFRPAMEAGMLLIEAQQVIALRMAGMAGVWRMRPDEPQRMVEEKTAAGQASMVAAMKAGLSGKSPADVAMAAMKPVRRQTKANAARLQKQATGHKG